MNTDPRPTDPNTIGELFRLLDSYATGRMDAATVQGALRHRGYVANLPGADGANYTLHPVQADGEPDWRYPFVVSV